MMYVSCPCFQLPRRARQMVILGKDAENLGQTTYLRVVLTY